MAGDWIPVRTDLWDDPQVVRLLSGFCPETVQSLSERVRIKSTIIGALVRTWGLFDSYTDDGILHGYDATTLNEIVGLPNWAENLQHIGWLEIKSQALVMPGFETWLSSSAKARMKDRERKRASRKNVSGNCPETVRKSADKTRTTEEKRREEKNTNTPPKVPQGGHATDADFQSFWKAYPKQRRTGGKAAYRKWQASVKELAARPEHDTRQNAIAWLLERCKAYARSPQGQSEFAVMPSVWLNQGRYDDEDEAWDRSDGKQEEVRCKLPTDEEFYAWRAT